MTEYGPAEFVAMSMISRVFSGAVGFTILIGTAVLALNLLSMKPDAKVLLAGYMGIGCIMAGVYLLFYAFTGEWRPSLASRKNGR